VLVADIGAKRTSQGEDDPGEQDRWTQQGEHGNAPKEVFLAMLPRPHAAVTRTRRPAPAGIRAGPDSRRRLVGAASPKWAGEMFHSPPCLI
jgi:hypothetical protein